MRSRTRTTRRGFTLIEGIVAIVVLSLAVPVSVAMLADASSARAASVQRDRAAMLVRLIVEEVVADAASSDGSLGLAPLASPAAYRSQLDARLAPLIEPYEDAGLSWTIEVGSAVSASGSASGDPDLNLYVPVTAVVTFADARNGARDTRVTVLVAGLHE